MSALKVVTGSTAEPITRDEAKRWLRVDEHEILEDSLIDRLIATARTRLEDYTQRSFLQQTFDLYLDDHEYPNSDEPIELPKAPLVSVSSITAFASTELSDSGGTPMSTSGYYVDTAHEFGRVIPISAFTYPTATRDINAAVVRFVAGYSTSTTGVPEPIKTGIGQLVAHLYEHRGDEGRAVGTLPPEVLETMSDYLLPDWG